MTIIYDKIAIIGVGLIGASIALAARRGLARSITGCEIDSGKAGEIEKLGLVDHVTTDAVDAVRDADLVVMAVVGILGQLAAQIVLAMKPGAVLTDTGSTKRSVLRDVDPHITGDIHWLPSHLLAGTEHSGPAAGFAELFEGRYSPCPAMFRKKRSFASRASSPAWTPTTTTRCWR